MKRGDDNELERKLRLEKVVARLAVETEEERRARLEKLVDTKWLRLVLETEEERRAKHGLNIIWIKFLLRLDFLFQGMSSLAL